MDLPAKTVSANKYSIERCKTIFRQSQYVIDSLLGTGTYGTVVRAEFKSQNYAIKISTVVETYEDERMALERLRGCEYIVHLHQAFDLDVDCTKYFCLVLDCVPDTMHTWIYRQNVKYDVKHVFKQVMLAIQHMHSLNIVHGDLTLSNILIDARHRVRICDFGLCIHLDKCTCKRWYNNLQAQWYRAPEMMLKFRYNTSAQLRAVAPKLDIWSCACVLYELHWKTPLFPGVVDEACVDQLDVIFQVIGTPSYMLPFVVAKQHPRNMKQVASPASTHLLSQMLEFLPWV